MFTITKKEIYIQIESLVNNNNCIATKIYTNLFNSIKQSKFVIQNEDITGT